MSHRKLNHEFDGPYTNPNLLETIPGVYIVWCQKRGNWRIIDVGESKNVIESIIYSDRVNDWKQNCSGTIQFSATYISDKQKRVNLEKKIRKSIRIVSSERRDELNEKKDI